MDGPDGSGLRAKALAIWEQAFDAEKELLVKGVGVVCRNCHKQHLYDIPVSVPDLVTRVKALEVLLNQQMGKPAESVEVRVSLPSTLEELEALSSAELAQLAAGDVVEGEWEELDDEREDLSR